MSPEENRDPVVPQEKQSSSNAEQKSFRPDHMLPDHTEYKTESTSSAYTESVTANTAVQTHAANTPGVLILQWLTYAFWGWTLVALYWLTGLSVSYFVNQDSRDSYSYDSSFGSNTFLAYAVAAVIVLFLVSIVCDIVYSKFEPRRKTGAATIIMVIHAVIFALCGIGSLIVAVFAFVNMLVSGDDNSGAITTMTTSMIMTLLYGITLLRTLHIEKIKRATQIYWVIMLLVTLGIMGLGIFGPVAYAQRTKNDRAIENGLPSLAYAINEYAKDNNKLPTSLNDASLQQSYYFDSNDVKRIVDEGLVQYKPKELIKSEIADSSTNGGVSVYTPNQLGIIKDNPVYHYQLCATYDVKDANRDYTDSSYRSRNQKYDTTLSTNGHPAGKVCYDLQTEYMYLR